MVIEHNNRKKILLVTIGDETRASSRLRLWDHIDWLETKKDLDIKTTYIHGPKSNLKSKLLNYAGLFCKHLKIYLQCLNNDVIYVQESLTVAPIFLLKIVFKKKKFVFDFSDPIDQYGRGLKKIITRILLLIISKLSDHIVIENKRYLKVLANTNSHLHHFYGPVNFSKYSVTNEYLLNKINKSKNRIRLGWTGSKATLRYIEKLFPILDDVGCNYNIELLLLGISEIKYTFKNINVRCYNWRIDVEFKLVPTFDIGLFALDRVPETMFRGAGKLFIYCAAGVPFVADNHGIAMDFMNETGLGYPVLSDEDWKLTLENTIRNVDERFRMSKLCGQYAKEHLSYDVYRSMILCRTILN